MKGGIGQLMKQAQQMQEKMQKAQEELQNIIVHGESGGGMVKISITCKNEIKKIDIDDSLFSEEKDMFEDLLIAAFNDAIRKADKKTQESMSGMTSGLNLPPGMKLPF
jgi:DNA-binding YbaB/EbfC family protein|tara:strand:- start:310 stop:633 length:324 start_codon:yes stop_codon:yes gene_type:complete